MCTEMLQELERMLVKQLACVPGAGVSELENNTAH
jgi:hypothetical protein